jgi:hypothetical protein
MNLSVPTKTARLTCGTRRSYQSMNLMTRSVSSAIVLCKRFTQYLISSSKEAASTLRIINRYERSMLKAEKRHAALTCGYTKSLDTSGTLQARAHKGLTPSRLRVARGVAAVIGISLSIPMAVADGGSIDAIQPRDYVRSVLPKHEAICLSRLIGKESAWNPKAIGNLGSPTKSYVYGLLQIKNPMAKDLTAIEQIDLGLRYIEHRYLGDSCLAWKHWEVNGWH